MKLSQYPVENYLTTPLRHRFADEWSRPGLTNFLGSVQGDADPTGLRHPIFPPVSGAEEWTAFLTVNGTFLPSSGVEVDVRWCPWQVCRTATVGVWKIESVLAMVPGEHAIVQRIEITNTGAEAAVLDVALRMSGRCVNRGLHGWSWAVPSVATTVGDLHGFSGLDPHIEIVNNTGRLFTYPQAAAKATPPDNIAGCGTLFNQPAPGLDPSRQSEAVCYQVLHPAPHRWNRNGDAAYSFDCAAGQSVLLDFALVLETDAEAAVAAGTRVVADVVSCIARAETSWKQTWSAAFQPGNDHFSGSLQDLDLPESLAPVAVSGVLGLLAHRRTLRVLDGVPHYNILTPRRCETAFYNWDFCLASAALARLDPEAVWRHLAIVWSQDDWRKYNQYNFMTGEGFGWPYRADTFNLFFAHWNLWEASGHSLALLERVFQTPRGPQSFLTCLEELAFEYRSSLHPSFGLADFGGKEGLLECVTTYEHMVASLNAGAVWCLERLADLKDETGTTDKSSTLREEAAHLAAAVMDQLYVDGAGFFQCLLPDGRKRDVRLGYDTGMVLFCMGERLTAKQQQEIVTFFQSELQTPGWLRSLSPQDADATVSGTRADHQFCGSYPAWPALICLGLLKIGRREIVEDWLSGIARTAMQGPFGQAHWDESIVPPTAGGATKVTDELPHGTHWSDISGSLFYEVLRQTSISKR